MQNDLRTSDEKTNIYTGKVGTAMPLWRTSKYLNSNDQRMPDIACSRNSTKSRGIGFCCDTICWDMFQCLKTDTPFAVNSELYNHSADVSDEILFGRAGLALLADYFTKKGMRLVNHRLVADILASILLTDYAWSWHGKVYFGAAHGTAGILATLKRLGGIARTDLVADLIAHSRLPSGNFKSSMGSNSDKLVQWCHGASGFTALLLAFSQDAHAPATAPAIAGGPGSTGGEVVGKHSDSSSLDLNLVLCDTVDVIWQRGILRKGCSICHGTAGNGYTFLSTYLHTRDESYLMKAVCFAEIILDIGVTECCAASDHPLSLFEGLSGTTQFLMDVAMILEAKQRGEGVHFSREDLFDGLAVF